LISDNLSLPIRFFFKELVHTIKDDCTPVDTSSVIVDEPSFQWEVYIATLVTWIICYFCMWKGVNSSSYVVWVTVPLPVLFIIVMVINNIQLEGASTGIKMYVTGSDLDGNAPDYMAKLSNGQMWSEACGQIFFSLGICMGSMTSYASYNPIDKPIIKDAFIIGLCNSCISIVAGFAVFSVVGYLSYLDHPVKDQTASIGLAFIAYPAAIDTLSGKAVWSFILAITLFMLGIDSAFSMLEAASTVIQDHPRFKEMPRKLIALILVLFGAVLSIFFTSNWGFTFFDVVDHYLNVYLMLLLGVMECFGVGWIYELFDIRKDEATIKSTNTLLFGYWACAVIIPPAFIFGMKGSAWVGIVVFWVLQIPIWIVSKMQYGKSLGEWYSTVFLYGVRKISRSMTKLSKEKGDTKRACWEPLFEFWWGFSIKFVVPFGLLMLLWLSAATDIESAYGGYHPFWQGLGIIFPALGFLFFIGPVFFPPGPEPFDHDVDAAFREDDVAGVGSLNPSAKEIEMAKAVAAGAPTV
jgi:SNF family Na+-dependent transporter